jgi:GMP synthase-like glutamine amidotransferase
MREKLLIVENISHEGPGLLETLLHEQGIGFELCDLSKGSLIPDTGRYPGVVVLGGPQSANDTSGQILHELQRVRETLDAGIPCLGICLGLQVMVKAAGGKVVPCRMKETGFHEPDGEPFTVRLTPEGKRDPLFRGLPDTMRVFQLHGETVVPTSGMTLLGTGKGCRQQVVRVGGNAWGLQCHFEMTRRMFEEWTLTDPDLISMKRDDLLAEFDRIHAGYTETGRTILLNFLDLCGLVMH